MPNTDPAQGHVKIDHDFTFDNFKYEEEIHYQLASKNFGLFKAQRYVQLKERLTRVGMKSLEFDGCSTLWFKTWDDFENFFTGPEHETKLKEDSKLFVDLEGGLNVFAGHDVIAFGKGIPDIDDQNGVTDLSRVEAAQ
ncbi:hypothetical protein G7Z17_g3097 [Cylindrodendrum hubeiense]|uniref:EthD domain-containing protein n=1 Tax=Cylindrodendrum hubeiense TaxID=595255 RepID=A0A9P5HJJ3_9HYPO|nr:hypothetical protein G7Z17_g3097 [Cylindrodendrum hubeiense]